MSDKVNDMFSLIESNCFISKTSRVAYQTIYLIKFQLYKVFAQFDVKIKPITAQQ